MFSGSFETSLDNQGRFTVPLRFREQRAPPDSNRLVITNSCAEGMRCLDVYPLSVWLLLKGHVEKLVDRENQSDRRLVMFRNYYLGGACECLIDKRGRVFIPPPLCR